jgi:hypothetical protein
LGLGGRFRRDLRLGLDDDYDGVRFRMTEAKDPLDDA